MFRALIRPSLLRTSALPPAAREGILALGSHAILPLIAILRAALEPLREYTDGGRWMWNDADETEPVGGWAARHALELLFELRAIDAIPAMLDLLEASSGGDEIYEQILVHLPRFGKDALEPTLARFLETEDDLVRGSLASVLSELGVKDDRVFDVLLTAFEDEPELGADNLVHYGDPRALPVLARAIATFEPEWEDRDPVWTLRVIVGSHEQMAPLPPEARAHFEQLKALCATRWSGRQGPELAN
jgi:hypothetical protein